VILAGVAGGATTTGAASGAVRESAPVLCCLLWSCTSGMAPSPITCGNWPFHFAVENLQLLPLHELRRGHQDVLESGFYRIPRFQRPYSWDRENIEDFWKDVVINSDADYFIGSPKRIP